MDITPLIPPGRQVIESYAGGRFRVSGTLYEGPLLVSPEQSTAWAANNFASLDAASFAPIIALTPPIELLLIGCGPRLLLLPRPLREALKTRGIAVECMDTGAACRTYNVLMAEGRRVAAALFST